MKRSLLVAICLVLAACTAKITGDLQVDGNVFAITECRSGQALGFSGIELGDSAGRHLRLIATADGGTVAALFPANAARGDTLGSCGDLKMHAQSSRINSIVNLEGSATLACEALGHKVAGSISFENCH